jgi:hypothetical protein
MATARNGDAERQDALTTVHEARARFEDAVRRALAAGATSPAGLVEAVHSDFTAIESELRHASPDAFESLTDRADRLSRLRAYVYPREEIDLEGRSLFADLSQWGVPAAILTEMQRDSLGHLAGQDEHLARGALRSLYDAYDYWGWYVDWYADFMRLVAWWLIGLEALALLVMVNRFVCGDIILGFVTAGVAGALVSVISKMPPLIADAESNAYVRRILMRVGTGTAAALIGGGFLASGLLNVALPHDRVTITELIEVCGRQDSCWPFCWWKQAISPTLALVPAAETQQLAPGAAAGAQAKTASVVVRCSTGGMLLLMALGVLLGFSERALTTFEDRLFTAGAGPPGGPSQPSTPPAPAPPSRPGVPPRPGSPAQAGGPPGSAAPKPGAPQPGAPPVAPTANQE